MSISIPKASKKITTLLQPTVPEMASSSASGTAASLANVHISGHPCLRAKLSQLRSRNTDGRAAKSLVHEIAMILATEALPSMVTSVPGDKDSTQLGFEYTTTQLSTDVSSGGCGIRLVPILRSGLAMVEAVQTILPNSTPVHHLGLYREPSTLQPVEYYNNLGEHQLLKSQTETAVDPGSENSVDSRKFSSLAIILDPVIATGGTCVAAIQALREWGVSRILVLSVVGARDGLEAAATAWPEGVEIWVAGMDQELTTGPSGAGGMLKPGLGDIGDRLFSTIGK